jgi:hypothetical protein
VPFEALCSPQADNVLRFDCSAEHVGTLSWTVWEGPQVVRTLSSEGPQHQVTLYGLRPSHEYSWSVEGVGVEASDALKTGALPAGVGDLLITVTGADLGVGQVMAPVDCGQPYIVIVSEDGAVLWYQAMRHDAPAAQISGFSWTEAGSVVTALDGDHVVEWRMDGSRGLEGNDYERLLHHDVHHVGGLTYALHQYPYEDYVVDGFYVLDSSGSVIATWSMSDTLPPPAADGGGREWSHGNSIWSDGSTVLLSLRWIHGVVAVAADPFDPSFGDVLWVLTGDASDLVSDFAWLDAGGFHGQHHARFEADGTLSLFDNGVPGRSSRALRISLDEGARTAREAQAWVLDRYCDIQGGSYPLPGGGVLVTCGEGGYAEAFGAKELEPHWRLDVSCAPGGVVPSGTLVPRVFPLPDF